MGKHSACSIAVWSMSLGCPKNRVDSEHCLGSLGCTLVPVEDVRKAELVFINTCAFIEPAVRESLKTMFDVIEDLADSDPKPLVVVAGCLVGRYGVKTLRDEIPEVDLWLEPKEFDKWPSKIVAALNKECIPTEGRFLSTPKSYAWLKIGEGCRHKCSFCTIPSIRGKLVSNPIEALVREAKTLLDQGVLELDLVAQDVSSFGIDTKQSLPNLLEQLAALPNLFWLRLLYLYPKGISDELLHCIQEISFPLLPYFDIPLQHVSSNILQAMGRPFEVHPRALIEKIRTVLPNACLRTTFIVGFPGESDADFNELLHFVEEEHFMHMGVFCYHAEEGTKAAQMSNQVARSKAQGRYDELMAAQQEISRKKLLSFVGTTQDVLVDSVHPEWAGLHTGRCWFQAPEVDGVTYISGSSVAPGRVCKGDIVESIAYDLTALEIEERP